MKVFSIRYHFWKKYTYRSNFFSIFEANKIFKYFIIKRDLIGCFYFINIFIFYWKRFFMLMKLLFFSLSPNFIIFPIFIYAFKDLYFSIFAFIFYKFIIFSFYICFQKFIFLKSIVFPFYVCFQKLMLFKFVAFIYAFKNSYFFLC